MMALLAPEFVRRLNYFARRALPGCAGYPVVNCTAHGSKIARYEQGNQYALKMRRLEPRLVAEIEITSCIIKARSSPPGTGLSRNRPCSYLFRTFARPPACPPNHRAARVRRRQILAACTTQTEAPSGIEFPFTRGASAVLMELATVAITSGGWPSRVLLTGPISSAPLTAPSRPCPTA